MLKSGALSLISERLVLRPLHLADAERLACLANNMKIARNMTDGFPYPYTTADAECFIKSDVSGLAIEETQNGEGLIGVVGSNAVSLCDQRYHRFGYWLGVDYWGNGYATEAASLYLEHILQTHNLRRIEASVYDWNPASGNVLEKIGFTSEARLEKSVVRFGDVANDLVYAMFPSN